MRMDWASLTPRERAEFTVLTAFLTGRLASAETVEWALAIRRHEIVKRVALLQLIDGPEGRKLGEPWQSVWRLIEEHWDNKLVDRQSDTRPYDVRERLAGGDRSGSLIAAITECVSPRLTVSAQSPQRGLTGKRKRKPRTIAQLISVGLDSGKVVDPRVMGLHEIADRAFLLALANALDGALTHGLDTARRCGWDGETKVYRLGQLHRVAFVPEAERKPGEHEPDEFHEGIAPCVKLLHFVANCLVRHDALAARSLAARWKLMAGPIHRRLWAALARHSSIADAADVGGSLLALDDRSFWDVQNYPEIAELRALRFAELDAGLQKALSARLRKTPPRNHWPRDADQDRVAGARRYWAVREMRRIEVAGGVLPDHDKAWLTAELATFPKLAAMTRLDEGFLGTPEASVVLPRPDARYDSLSGDERLSALEVALGSARRGWDDDVSSRAWDWMRQAGNAAKLIPDFENSADVGVAYPKVWERFGWAHSPAPDKDGSKPLADNETGVTRILTLLTMLPESAVRSAIEGLSNWLASWETIVAKVDSGLAVWLKMWPIAVAATNEVQPVGGPIDLNLVARSSDDREPMDLDTLNTPAGRLVGVFLAACPRVDGSSNPFAGDGTPRTMRETIIRADGRSGLIVRHRLIEHLPYFLLADPDWTQEHLIAALLNDDSAAVSLWRALARRTQFVDVIRIIGSAMVMRVSDLRLGRETRRALVFSLVVECLHALNEGREPAVPFTAIQQMLRALDDELRARAAGAIQQFIGEISVSPNVERMGPSADELFARAAVPFLRDVWPQERSLTTSGVSKALADLPATVPDCFVSAVDAIERFLVPFDAWSLLDYGLFGEQGEEPKLLMINTVAKAAAFLRLLNATIGTALSAVVPYDLATALARVEEVAPNLTNDPNFRRLATAARR